MFKRKLLGILNVFISFCFTLFLMSVVQYYFDPKQEFDLGDLSQIAPILLFLCFHLFLVYKLLFKNDNKHSLFLYLLLTFSPLFYTILFFAGYYYATSLIFQICFLILIFLIYYSFKRFSKKIALILSIAALLAMTISFINGFEEDYCLEVAGRDAPIDIKDAFIPATKEDVMLLTGYLGSVNEGDKIAIHFRNHIKCHKTFNFVSAVRDEWEF